MKMNKYDRLIKEIINDNSIRLNNAIMKELIDADRDNKIKNEDINLSLNIFLKDEFNLDYISELSEDQKELIDYYDYHISDEFSDDQKSIIRYLIRDINDNDEKDIIALNISYMNEEEIMKYIANIDDLEI